MQTIIFAAGCFWGVQAYFDQVPGVEHTTVGYTGGHVANPTYEQVCAHTTGHAEAVRIEFDPKKVSYGTLLKHFFRMHDPTQLNRQGLDVGDSYRSAIFYTSDEQKDLAEKAKVEAQAQFDKPVVTEITTASEFYKAEAYHQKYFEKTGRGACHVPYQPL
ncbi:MAG: peptide-methionine (S)-S-oxide reductase MsrA [Candidatus Saccharimonadales bacterium]